MAVLNFEIKSVPLPSGEEAKSVFLSGSIDASTNQSFEGRLQDILSSGTNKVLLVLTNVKYINSTGLGTIVKCVDTFRENGGDIKLVGVPSKVIALFEMLGLLALFETYETIEEAVASFGSEETNIEAETSDIPAVQFPIQFKHPISGMGLNVSQPGRFKDPRSGDYFSVDSNGTIEFYEMSKTKVIDVKMPVDAHMTPGLIAMANAQAKSLGLSSDSTGAIERSIDEACSLINRNGTDANETIHFLFVGDKEKLQIGIVSYGQALAISANEPAFQVLQQSMDEVKHTVLPTRGHLLTLVKNL